MAGMAEPSHVERLFVIGVVTVEFFAVKGLGAVGTDIGLLHATLLNRLLQAPAGCCFVWMALGVFFRIPSNIVRVGFPPVLQIRRDAIRVLLAVTSGGSLIWLRVPRIPFAVFPIYARLAVGVETIQHPAVLAELLERFGLTAISADLHGRKSSFSTTRIRDIDSP
jgi:hypothetical protein